jgi:hypothetical protein
MPEQIEVVSDTQFKVVTPEAQVTEKNYDVVALRYEEKRLTDRLAEVGALIKKAEQAGIDTEIDTTKPFNPFKRI